MTDTPRAFCQGCRVGEIPDPLTDFTEACSAHRPDVGGSADAQVVTNPELWSLYAPSEAEAETNRAMCAVIHRGRAEEEEVPMDYAPPLIAGAEW